MRLYVFIIYGFIGCVHIPYAFLIISVWKQCPFVPLTGHRPSSLRTLILSYQNWTWYSSQKYKGKLMFFFLFFLSVYSDHKQILARFWPKEAIQYFTKAFLAHFMLNTVLCRNTYGNAFYFIALGHLPPQTSWIYLMRVRSSLPQVVILLEETGEFCGAWRVIWGACGWPGNVDHGL